MSIRFYLIGANLFALAVPAFAVVALRIYDTYLVRQTERQLIAQSVVIGEAYREYWRDETGGDPRVRFRPPGEERSSFVPIEPQVDLFRSNAASAPTVFPSDPSPETPAHRAGQRLEPLLRRAQVFNLSGVRVLDGRGCVVATTRSNQGRCLHELPEVARALEGGYASVTRPRVSDEPPPPVTDVVRRRGKVRVFTALPIFSDGKVIGVIRNSRTSLDALSSLWRNRRGLIVALGLSAALVLLVSLVFSGLIARPVRRLTQAAQTIAQGDPADPRVPGRGVPDEIRDLGQALATMTLKLRERAEYVSEFATHTSHELKSPLTAIRGAAELLREQWDRMEDAQRERFVANIDHDAQRMERLVTRLLLLAKIEHAPQSPTAVDVRDFFTALSELYDGKVTVDSARAPETVEIDPDHLRSAVSNLIDNGLRVMPGGPVEVRVSNEQGRLRVDVKDRGPGIDPHHQERLFERFFTTDRDEGGTGLGLAIVKAVAAAQGGEVTFETGPGGTTFRLVL